MHLRYRFIPLFAVCWIVFLLIADRNRTTSSASNASEAAPAVEHEVVPDTQAATHDEETQSRMAAVSRMEQDQRRRGRAAAQKAESRKELQILKRASWSNVLATNWQSFQALRRQAAVSPDRKAPCTLCDGNGHLGFCILCTDSGTCATCAGTGRAAREEYCPTCLGSGKCYLCFGSGKMSCPFCIEGTVEAGRPLPPNLMPVE